MLGKNICAIVLGALTAIPGALGYQTITSDISALKTTLSSATETIVRYDGSILGAVSPLLAVRKLHLSVEACKSGTEASDVLTGDDSEEVANGILDIYPEIISTLERLGPKISTFDNPAVKFVSFALLHVFQAEEAMLIDMAMEKLDQEHTSQLDAPDSQVKEAFKKAIKFAS